MANSVRFSYVTVPAAVLTPLVRDDPRRLKLTFSSPNRYVISPDPAWNPATQPGFEISFAASGISYQHFCRCDWGEIVRRGWNGFITPGGTIFIIEELEGGYS